MGILRGIKRVFYTAALTSAGAAGYLGATTEIVSPLPRDDPLWKSKSYAKYNVHGNSSTQDICVKRIPLDKIKPELLEREGDLALAFCRGVWGGIGYEPQRAILARKHRNAETKSQLWSVKQLATSTYEPGTQITNHLEVVEKTPTEIYVRCGDSPMNGGPRDSDGLFVIGAEVDRARSEVVLRLKSCFFVSSRPVEGFQGPMPGWIEELHRWYSRLWMTTGSWKVTR